MQGQQCRRNPPKQEAFLRKPRRLLLNLWTRNGSEVLFGDEPDERGETPQSRLDKFSGSSAVSSADIFGDQRQNSSQATSLDSVRDSASRVAGNLGNMAGNALSAGWSAFNQIKDNYS